MKFVEDYESAKYYDTLPAFSYEFYDYLYSDTDSIKVINIDKHKTYIDKYNKIVRKKLELACLHHNINPEVTRPKNNKGKVKELGVWEWEKEDNELHSYKRFKTLGAKRYMIEFYNGKYSLTVSGLNKKVIDKLLDYEYLKKLDFIFVKIDGYKRDRIDHSDSNPNLKIEWQSEIPFDYVLQNLSDLDTYKESILNLVKEIKNEST